jgi:hypothetical protein
MDEETTEFSLADLAALVFIAVTVGIIILGVVKA